MFLHGLHIPLWFIIVEFGALFMIVMALIWLGKKNR